MEMDPGKLFIGGISWDTNEERLKQYFGSFGEVMEAMIMKDRATGRARGFGFVVFSDPAAADRVLLEKHIIDGKTVEAKKAVPRDDHNTTNRNNGSTNGSPGLNRTKKIFVGGLASTITENDFKSYFDQFGVITDVVVMYDHNTQRPRGFGFITYNSEEAVDKVLHKSFHELNGKMVEVKRAVPKELSPGPCRSQLGGYNYGQNRMSSFLNGYTPGYSPSSVGGLGARMDGRFSPITVGRNSSVGHDYGIGLNFEPWMGANRGENRNFISNLNYARDLNPFYTVNSSMFGSPRNGGGNMESSPSFILKSRNMWGNENFNYAASSVNFSSREGFGNENLGIGSSGNGAIWGSSLKSYQGGAIGTTYNSRNFGNGYGNGNATFAIAGGGILGRNSGNSVELGTPFAGFSASYADFRETDSLLGETAWRPLPLDLEESDSFNYGIGNATSNVIRTEHSGGYVGAYGITNRQSERGIAA